MTRFTIASFNVKNLIGADQEYYQFQQYTPEEYAWKQADLAERLVTMNADIVGFQEIFEQDALKAVIAEADAMGASANAANLPDRSKPYRKKAVFRKLGYAPYTSATLAFAPNVNDGAPGQRRPGVAILSRLGFADKPQIIQQLETPLNIPLQELGGADAGHYTISRLSRPILRVRVPFDGETVTVFNCHLKSKLGEFIRPPNAAFAPESDLTRYDAAGRAMGALRAALRRMAEAWVLRRAILDELNQGRPTIVMGDFNDNEHSVASEIIAGEVPFRNYAWMLRHNASHGDDRYSHDDARQINDNVTRLRLHSAEALFVRQSLRDMVFTSAFNGVYESIDAILLSRHFLPEYDKNIGQMEYFSVFNDHLTDGLHPEAPYNKLASDHGQIMAHIRMGRDKR